MIKRARQKVFRRNICALRRNKIRLNQEVAGAGAAALGQFPEEQGVEVVSAAGAVVDGQLSLISLREP